MRERNFSIPDVARLTGFERQNVYKYLTNQSTPNVMFVMRLSEVLHTTTDFLLLGKKNKKTP